MSGEKIHTMEKRCSVLLNTALFKDVRKSFLEEEKKYIHTKWWVDTAHDKESKAQMGLGALVCSYQSGPTTRLYDQGHAREKMQQKDAKPK